MDKQRKVDNGKALLDIYIKKKNPDSHVRSDYYCTSGENTCDATLMTSDQSAHGTGKDVHKMDAESLHKKTAQFDTLNKKMKHLQDELSEKSERITALEIENKVLRLGSGDGVRMSPRDSDKEMIKELQKMVDGRDTYIRQLSDSLQKGSEENKALIQRETELMTEVHNLKLQMSALTKQMEMKLSESYSESVEYKAKVELMSSQIQEYSELTQSLRATIENKNREFIVQKEELTAKDMKLEKYKCEMSTDIKNLMRQVEILNYDLSKRENELVKSKKEVEELRSQLEEQFGNEILSLKTKLENKYAEDVKKVEVLYDGMLLEQIRKSDYQLKAVEERSCLEDEIKSCKEAYEKEIKSYKEELQTLLEQSKATEENLTCDLEKYKQEADYLKQQVINIENKVAEEKQKLQQECFKELDQCESKMKQERSKHEVEILKLAKNLKEIAVVEAAKEVELESYKNELEKLQQYVTEVEEKFNWSRDEYERQKSQLIAEINEFRNNELQLMNELRISREKLIEYETQAYEFNENLKDQSNKFSEKYKAVVRTFEEQIQNLMNELERTKTFHEEEISHCKSVINEKENQIKNLVAKVNYFNTLKANKANENNTTPELSSNQELVQEHLDQITTLKKNLMVAEKLGKSNTEFLFMVLNGLKNIKSCINKILSNSTEENPQNFDTSHFECNTENLTHENIAIELEKTICDILNMTQDIDPRNISVQSRLSNAYTSTPRVSEGTDHFSDPSPGKDDPGSDVVKKCELLEDENMKLTRKLGILRENFKEMEYCLCVAYKESMFFDKKCKDLDSKITELETLKLSEFMLKKENNELKERLMYVEESEKNIRKELGDLVENNIKLERLLHKSIVDLHQQVINNGPDIKLEVVLTDLKAKSEEVIHLRSQLASIKNVQQENEEKMMQMKTQCDKFIAEHDFMMSEIKTKQKELEDVWKERNDLSTENKMLQSKLVSVQGKSCWQLHKIPSVIRSSSTFTGYLTDKESETLNMPVPEKNDEFREFHLKRLQTMHLLTESIGMSSKTSIRDSASNYSVRDEIDLELQKLDEMFEEPLKYHMPTITEEDEEYSEEDRVFFDQLAQGDQHQEQKVHPK